MSNKEERKAPVLRFKGFTDDWEQRKFTELGKLYYGKSAPKWSVVEKGGTPCIRYGELYTKYSSKIDNVYSHTSIDKSKLKFSTGNELLIPRVGEEPLDFAKHTSWLSIPNVAIGEMITVLKTKENPLFLANYLRAKYVFKFARLVEGGNVSNLYFERYEDTNILIPSKNEQQNISKLILKIDKLITLQQRKLKELQQVKQTLSQFLLNGNTHTRPTLRLNGFEDIWKENKLKDIAKISMGQSPSSNNYNKKGNGKILIQGNADIDNGGIRPRVWTTEITKLANKNDILLTVRAPVGELAITNREVVIGRGIAAIKGNKFIYNLLVQKNKEHFWDRISSGSTFKSISSNDIKQLKVYIPSEKEETLIASVLETIKNKIDFQNERINVINKLKKYLLTNLFI